MRDDEKIENLEEIRSETGVLQKKRGRKSVLEEHTKEIVEYLDMGVGIASIWKILSSKKLLKKKITYNGFYRYCKRNNL